MQEDIVFEGILAAAVSVLFIYVSTIEIPFYPIEAQVQRLAILLALISIGVVLFGLLYRGKRIASLAPKKID